ncbi:MAG TPA: 2-amino-4-hydroxy-6-hydroxymethyldihydropteridine diphosphokinase [Salinisphaeraceae bacterium]|nr:2-amino-4-hydroxy-6-hydroxymethyldihydropteridine diphosphokinase [Salinisphaeraceae bacterium]
MAATSEQVFIGVGSNIEPRRHIAQALRLLRQRFGTLQVSTIYACPAIGFDGAMFGNLVVGFDTDLAALDLVHALRAIEQQCGRPHSDRTRSRTMDLDLLLYGEHVLETADLQVPRVDILRFAFVLKPLAELLPDGRHPVLGSRYRDLWAAFDASEQPLTPMALAD